MPSSSGRKRGRSGIRIRRGKRWRPKALAALAPWNRLQELRRSGAVISVSMRYFYILPLPDSHFLPTWLTQSTTKSDLQDLNYSSSGTEDEDSGDESLDPISAERKRRAKRQDHLRRSAGEPVKPPISEVTKMRPGFLVMLRMVLAE